MVKILQTGDDPALEFDWIRKLIYEFHPIQNKQLSGPYTEDGIPRYIPSETEDGEPIFHLFNMVPIPFAKKDPSALEGYLNRLRGLTTNSMACHI